MTGIVFCGPKALQAFLSDATMDLVLKACKGCHNLFMPVKSSDDKCANCVRPRPEFDRNPVNLPVDLWLAWSGN